MSAHIEWATAGEFVLHAAYDAGFVRELKASIPQHGRKWDPTIKAWRCREWSLETVRALCREWFGNVVVAPKPEAASPAPTIIPAHFRTLHVMPDAPEEVVTAAYRALARKYHPDVAGVGATAQMQAINDAFDQVRARR